MSDSSQKRNDTLFLVVVLSASICLRYSVSLHPYSGEHNVENRTREDGTPMFGDYEAQRHWMEITRHLPAQDWYFETKDNDLLYWGLDYPPLTAYHSMLCGYVLGWLEPAAVALHASRGYETPSSRLFMRLASLLFDLLIYHTGILAVAYALYPTSENSSDEGVKTRSKSREDKTKKEEGTGEGWVRLGGGPSDVAQKRGMCVVFGFLSPGLIVIDHGHFQFNAVCLGLAAWAVALLLVGARSSSPPSHAPAGITLWDLLGSVCFVLALCFKQIALYYAPTFFCYLLGRCLQRPTTLAAIGDVAKLGSVVIATFAVNLLPWLSVRGVAQVLHRVFPIARGLFEDKVANFWCAAAPVLRLKSWVPKEHLFMMSLAATILAILPSSILLLRSPTPRVFLLGLLNSALAFFLFAYQVHEKSILFALLPLALVQAESPGLSILGMILNSAALASMYPLLVRDGLAIPYLTLHVITWSIWWILRPFSVPELRSWQVLALFASPAASFLLHLIELKVPAPPRYPDIHVLLLMMVSAGWFVLSFLASNLLQTRMAERSDTKPKRE